MKGFAPILILALWLSPSQALPDLLAPFRNMFGMSKPSSSSPSSSGSHPKQLTSSKDPSANHVYRQFGGGPPGSGGPPGGHHESSPHHDESDNPFNSNFGFGSPPSDDDHHSSPPHHGGGHSGHPGGPSPGSFAPGRGPSSRPSNKPYSSQTSSGGPPRQVRQQPGSPYGLGHGAGSGSHRPSHAPPGHSQPISHRPGKSLGGRPHGGPGPHHGPHGGPGPHDTEDDQPALPEGFQEGRPPPFNPRGPPSYSPQSNLHGYQNGPPPPSFHSSSPGYNQGGGGGPPSYSSGGEGEPGPYPGGPPAGTQYSHSTSHDLPDDGPSQAQGFNGFGSFGGGPSNSPEDDGPHGGPGSRGPPPGGRGPGGPGFRSGPRPGPFRASRPGPDYEASNSPPRYPGGGPRPSSAPPTFFGGPNNYPEQYQGHNRDTRQPDIITADDVRRFPPQIEDDEEQGGPPGSGFVSPPQGYGGPSQSGSAPPSFFPSSAPFHNEDGPGGSPHYHQSSRPRYPSGSGNSYAFSRPVSAGYQASAESVHYGKPMMMSASGTNEARVHPKHHQQKRSPGSNGEIIRLSSPKDPNYRAEMDFGGSSLNPVSSPYEPDTAATGHHGGHEGLSNNGDRILYHVSGHQGPHSYRFGYDTGKGYNRLFRFEEKDGKGYVKGKYGFYDKHGKLNVINYEAHPKHGYHAERGHSHGYY